MVYTIIRGNKMIKPSIFKSQIELLKWLKRGGVKWTKKCLSDIFKRSKSFQTFVHNTRVYVIRLGVRRYFVSNYGISKERI